MKTKLKLLLCATAMPFAIDAVSASGTSENLKIGYPEESGSHATVSIRESSQNTLQNTSQNPTHFPRMSFTSGSSSDLGQYQYPQQPPFSQTYPEQPYAGQPGGAQYTQVNQRIGTQHVYVGGQGQDMSQMLNFMFARMATLEAQVAVLTEQLAGQRAIEAAPANPPLLAIEPSAVEQINLHGLVKKKVEENSIDSLKTIYDNQIKIHQFETKPEDRPYSRYFLAIINYQLYFFPDGTEEVCLGRIEKDGTRTDSAIVMRGGKKIQISLNYGFSIYPFQMIFRKKCLIFR